jgi:hypothetical protein
MTGRALVTGAALTACMLMVVGCGSDSADAGKAEQGIESSLTNSTIKVTSASCPDDAKKQKGGTFTCDAKLGGGGSAKVTVTQTSDHNTFTYSFKPGSVQLPGATVDKAVEQSLAAKGIGGTTVKCPATVPVKTGQTVTCPVTGSGGRQGQVSFTFSDDSGTVDPSSVKES